jgi:hypothetical protein
MRLPVLNVSTDLADVHRRCGQSAAVEGLSDLVPRGRAGLHDRP